MARGIRFLGERVRRHGAAAILLASAVSVAVVAPVPASAMTRPIGRSHESARAAAMVTDSLFSVAVVPHSKDVIAVGAVYSSASARNLVEMWRGQKWVSTSTPKTAPGVTFPQLTAVWAASATDAWAVGGATEGSLPTAQLLRWGGRAWRTAAVAGLPKGADFSSVSGSSADNLWAVGSVITNPRTYASKPLEAHFNGKRWSVSEMGPAGGSVTAVSVVSARDAWAIGGFLTTTKTTPFILHFNGKRWSTVKAPIPAGSYLGALSAKGTTVWVSGITSTTTSSSDYLLHLSGRRWSKVATPRGVTGEVRALTTVSSSVLWMAASTTSTAISAEYTKGRWHVTKLPSARSGTSVAAMGGSSSSDLWAVGGSWSGRVCASNELPVSYHHTSSWKMARMPFVTMTAAPALEPRC